MSLLVIAVLLSPVVAPATELEVEYSVEIEELPGGAVSPGGASYFTFEYEFSGARLLFWGWTGADDIRVMNENLDTVKTIDLPTEDFQVHGTRWSDWGSVIVWGNNGTGTEDSLLVYQYPDLELNVSFLPRETIPLETIDSAILVAGDLIIVVAGRDANGTSRILTFETQSNRPHAEHNVTDNLTIQTIGAMGMRLVALDVEGGATIINTSAWYFEERLEMMTGPFSCYYQTLNHPWTLGNEVGQVRVMQDFLLNQSFTYTVEVPPVQGACWIGNNNSDNIVVASPLPGGGSRIQVFHQFYGEFQIGDEVEIEGFITTLVPDPDVYNGFSVGTSDGAFMKFNVTDNIFVEPEPEEDDDNFPKWGNWFVGVLIILVIVLIVWRMRKARPTENE